MCRFAWNFKTDAIQHLTSAPSLNVAMEAGSSGHNNNLPKMYMLPFVCDPYQKWEIETSKYRRGHCCEIGFPKVDMVPDQGHTRSHESGFWSPTILKFSSQQNRQTPVSEKKYTCSHLCTIWSGQLCCFFFIFGVHVLRSVSSTNAGRPNTANPIRIQTDCHVRHCSTR